MTSMPNGDGVGQQHEAEQGEGILYVSVYDRVRLAMVESRWDSV